MKFDIKTYHYGKIKNILRNKNIILIYTSNNSNSLNWVKTEQCFYRLNMKYFKLNTVLSTKILNKSIYKNYSWLFQGSNMLIFINDNLIFSSSKLKKTDIKFTLLGIKIKKKLYCNIKPGLLISYKFSKNMCYLNKFIKIFIKNLVLFKFLNFKKGLG